MLVNSAGNVDVTASNVTIGDEALVRTGGDFNMNAAANTQKTNEENSELEVEVGVKVGNAYVDAGMAAKALADATKKLAQSKQKLDKMKDLKDQGRASQKAVDLAYAQVALATANVANATTSAALAAAGAASAASTSIGTGMYGASYMDTTAHTDFTKTETEQSVGSTFVAGDDIDIGADGDFNMIGSILQLLRQILSPARACI